MDGVFFPFLMACMTDSVKDSTMFVLVSVMTIVVTMDITVFKIRAEKRSMRSVNGVRRWGQGGRATGGAEETTTNEGLPTTTGGRREGLGG